VSGASPVIRPLVCALLLSWGCGTIPGQDVQYEPTPMPVVHALLELADVGPQDVVYDLGSGDGRIPITAAKEFGARGVGIEIDPQLVAESTRRAARAGLGDRVRFTTQDLFQADLRPATVVTLYLTRELNIRLRPKLLAELRPGTRVVSHRFDMGDWAPEREVKLEVDGNPYVVYLWRVP